MDFSDNQELGDIKKSVRDAETDLQSSVAAQVIAQTEKSPAAVAVASGSDTTAEKSTKPKGASAVASSKDGDDGDGPEPSAIQYLTQVEAKQRSALIENTVYDVSVALPKGEMYFGHVDISFDLKSI